MKIALFHSASVSYQSMSMTGRPEAGGPPVGRVQLDERVDELLGHTPPLADGVERRARS